MFLESVFWRSKTSQNCYFFFFFRSIFKLVILNYDRFDVLHHQLSLKNNTCRGVLRRKTVDLNCCIRVLIVQSFHKIPPINTFYRHWKTSSFVTHNYGFHFFHQRLNEKLFSCENFLNGKFVDFVPCFGIPIFRSSKQAYLKCFISIFIHIILCD